MQTTSAIEEALDKQPTLTRHFMTLAQEARLSHAYLFSGMTGCGKKALALSVAMRLFCETPTADGLPCGHCAECRRILAGDNPDVVVEAPEGQRIKVDQVRHIKDEFSKSAVEGKTKIFIIEGAETLTPNAANGLLKFIEEPADNRVIFLLTTNKSLILPTIISRAQLVEFSLLAPKAFQEVLTGAGISANQAALIGALTNSVEDATAMTEDDWVARVQAEVGRWYTQLVKGDATAFVTVQTGLMPLASDRSRQAILLDVVVILWHDTLNLKYLDNNQTIAFPKLRDVMVQTASQVDEVTLLRLVETALQTKSALASNMNFQNIMETMTLAGLDLLK